MDFRKRSTVLESECKVTSHDYDIEGDMVTIKHFDHKDRQWYWVNVHLDASKKPTDFRFFPADESTGEFFVLEIGQTSIFLNRSQVDAIRCFSFDFE